MIKLLMKTMEQPLPFGPFHLAFFFGFLVLAVLLLVFARKCKDKAFRTIVFIAWLIIVLFETGKQIVWNTDASTLEAATAYNWYSFPFQLCSLPLYVWPLVALLPESKFRTVLNTYVSTFIFFGGFAYFFFPVSFCGYTFINIQTMVHHGMQFVIGIFIFVHEYDKMRYVNVLKATIMLIVSCAIAIGLNYLVDGVLGHGCNYFELNPIHHTEAMVFGDILKATSYPAFLAIYVVGFLAFASVCFWAMKGSVALARAIGKKH